MSVLKFVGFSIVVLLFCGASISGYKKDHGFGYFFKHDPNMKQREKAEKLTSDKIREALGGIGGGNLFPDPFTVQDIQTKYSGASLYFTGLRIYGLDRYRPIIISTDLANLFVTITLSLDQISMLGDFRMTPWVVNAEGPLKYSISDAWLTLEAELMFSDEGTDKEGLQIKEIREAQLTHDELSLDFENLGFLNTLLQPVKGSIASYIFNQIKPTLLSEAEFKFRILLNKVLTNLPKESPNAVNIVDRALIRARNSMKSSQLEPLFIPDSYPKSTKVFKVELTQGKLFGLSTIKRTGPILVAFERDAVHMMLNMGVQNLKGQYSWTCTVWKNLLSHRGTLTFNVNNISIKVKLEKHLNSQNNGTQVEKIDMHIGSVTLQADGAMKYIMETLFNVVPDSFRQKITDAAEYRIMKVIEDEVEKIDLEQLVEDDTSESMESP